MESLYRADAIRAAERPLLESQKSPDELMMCAADAVAQAAAVMLRAAPEPNAGDRAYGGRLAGAGHVPVPAVADPTADRLPGDPRVVLLVGSGGNGGDALYAGARLALLGARVTAVLFGSQPHARALKALTDAGGTAVSPAETKREMFHVELAIDGIAGIGGRPGLRPEAARGVKTLEEFGVPILAVDVPSGVDADTGVAGSSTSEADPAGSTKPRAAADDPEGAQSPARQELPGHVTAAATVTFGGLRRVHALNPACGEVVLTDISTAEGSLTVSLARETRPAETLVRATERSRYPWGAARLHQAAAFRLGHSTEPRPEDDKYSSGATGVLAGSPTYPGAGHLAVAGALRATPGMVRYVGSDTSLVSRHPEVVAAGSLSECGQVQAWVYGPGRGTGKEAAKELAELLRRPEPLIIDADGLSVLAQSQQLREAVAAHGRCVLTPHAGEFARLAGDPGPDRVAAARDLAAKLAATVVLKGRLTVVAGAARATVVDCTHSWAATPGSGDVLSGMVGAFCAAARAHGTGLHEAVVSGVCLHAEAAWIAAHTPDGTGPILARDIAQAIPQAIARAARR